MKRSKPITALILSGLFLCLLFTSCGYMGSETPSHASQIPDNPSGDSIHANADSLLLSCEITGQGSSSPYGDLYQPETDAPYMLRGYSTLSLAESDTGFYFIGIHKNGTYLYYMPKDTMKPLPLCNKPNCLHEQRKDDQHATFQEIEETRMECNAYVDNIKNIFYYKGSLYCIGNFDALSQDQALYRVSADGAEKEKIYSFRFKENYDENGQLLSSTPVAAMVGDVSAHRGFLYYIVQTPERAVLYRLPFESEVKEPEALYIYQSNDAFIQLKFYDHYLYLGDFDQNGEKIYSRIDVETGEILSPINIGEGASFYEGKLFSLASGNQEEFYLSDLDGNHLTKIPDPCTHFMGSVTGPYILGYDLSEEEMEKGQYTFTLYNSKGEIQGNFTVASEGEPYIEGASGNILFLSLVTNGNREHYYLDFSTQTLSLFFSDTN